MFNNKLKKQLVERDKAIEILTETVRNLQKEREELREENGRLTSFITNGTWIKKRG